MECNKMFMKAWNVYYEKVDIAYGDSPECWE